MTFEAGEVVSLQRLTAPHAHLNGREVTLLGCVGPLTSSEGIVARWWQAVAPWITELSPNAQWIGISELCLRKRKPPLDWRAIAGVREKPRALEPA